nr:hypothetical protein CFP56_05562 [Quercus suber]
MLAETMASTFREHFPHYVANGFQPDLVAAWEHTHGVHVLFLYLTLKKERAFCNAEVPKWLAISEGEDSMKSIEDLIDILTELSPLP